MKRKFSALLAAVLFAATTFAPVAEARDGRRGYSERHYDRGYDRHRGRYRDNNDELAAGAVGLILGLAIGSMASQPSQPRASCYDRYQRCAAPPPPQQRYDDRYQRDSYYDDRGGDSAYARDYGLEGGGDGYYEDQRPPCIRRERQWDRYANQYVTVDVPC